MDFFDRLRSQAFAETARCPDHSQAFPRARQQPVPRLVSALLSFRGASVQNELDACFGGLSSARVLVSDRGQRLMAPVFVLIAA